MINEATSSFKPVVLCRLVRNINRVTVDIKRGRADVGRVGDLSFSGTLR
jgi:hypothetical protein